MSINLYGIHAAKSAGSVTPAAQELAARRYEAVHAVSAEPIKSDTVTISSEGSLKRDAARISRSVMRQMDRGEAAYQRRVEDIRSRIQSNTYQVSSDRVADAIISRACGADW